MIDRTGNNPTIRIHDGSLYLDLELYRTYFKNLESVILFRRSEKIFIAPVAHPGGGGLLMKIRNARGDRVVHAREFLRDCGLDEPLDRVYRVYWNAGMAALEIVISAK